MADVLFYHVVGDITIGKPRVKEFPHSASVRDALKALKLTNRVELAVWKMARRHTLREDGREMVQKIQTRFVGILSLMDIMTHLASPQSLQDPEWAMESPVSDIVCPNPGLIQHVTPATRLDLLPSQVDSHLQSPNLYIEARKNLTSFLPCDLPNMCMLHVSSLYDALQIIQKGVRTLLVPLNSTRQKLSTHFSVIYHGRWILPPPARPDQQLLKQQQEYCCLTVEDVVRFLTGCLGALAPIPLKSVDSLGIINKNILTLDLTAQALEATNFFPKSSPRGRNTVAIAVVKAIGSQEDATLTPRRCRLFGEISSFSFTGCDEKVIFAFATMSAAEFVIYCNYSVAASFGPELRSALPPEAPESSTEPLNTSAADAGLASCDSNIDADICCRKCSGLVGSQEASPEMALGKPSPSRVGAESQLLNTKDARNRNSCELGHGLLDLRGKMSVCPRMSKLITCRPWNSLAAVLAQMLAHGATHVWVTKGDGSLFGIVTYVEIVAALCNKSANEPRQATGQSGPACSSLDDGTAGTRSLKSSLES